MSKSERKAFLLNRYHALFGVALVAMLPVGKREIRETAKETKSQTATNDEIQDEETLGVTPSITFDNVSEKTERETDSLLSAKEKAILHAEVSRLRFAKSIPSQLLLTA